MCVCVGSPPPFGLHFFASPLPLLLSLALQSSPQQRSERKEGSGRGVQYGRKAKRRRKGKRRGGSLMFMKPSITVLFLCTKTKRILKNPHTPPCPAYEEKNNNNNNNRSSKKESNNNRKQQQQRKKYNNKTQGILKQQGRQTTQHCNALQQRTTCKKTQNHTPTHPVRSGRFPPLPTPPPHPEASDTRPGWALLQLRHERAPTPPSSPLLSCLICSHSCCVASSPLPSPHATPHFSGEDTLNTPPPTLSHWGFFPSPPPSLLPFHQCPGRPSSACTSTASGTS